jgi:hypothetical protein
MTVVVKCVFQCLRRDEDVLMLHIFGDALKSLVVQGGTIHVHLMREGGREEGRIIHLVIFFAKTATSFPPSFLLLSTRLSNRPELPVRRITRNTRPPSLPLSSPPSFPFLPALPTVRSCLCAWPARQITTTSLHHSALKKKEETKKIVSQRRRG